MWPVKREVRLLVVGEMPALDEGLERAVAEHWRRSGVGRGLFNGRVFSATRVEAGVVEGHWTEYRRVVAQMEEPQLAAWLGIQSVAVCGVVVGVNGVVVGRREARAAYQAGLWQLAPAGSVDFTAATAEGADWQVALFAELREELGIEENEVAAMTPLCLVQHPSGVLDLGVRIECKLDEMAILARHRARGNGEYDRLMVVPPDQVEAAVAAEAGELVPSAWPLLARAFPHAGNPPTLP